MLLPLAVYLAWPSSNLEQYDRLGTPGVLQMTWLMAENNRVPQELHREAKEQPDEQMLLDAGRKVFIFGDSCETGQGGVVHRDDEKQGLHSESEDGLS